MIDGVDLSSKRTLSGERAPSLALPLQPGEGTHGSRVDLIFSFGLRRRIATQVPSPGRRGRASEGGAILCKFIVTERPGPGHHRYRTPTRYARPTVSYSCGFVPESMNTMVPLLGTAAGAVSARLSIFRKTSM